MNPLLRANNRPPLARENEDMRNEMNEIDEYELSMTSSVGVGDPGQIGFNLDHTRRNSGNNN